MTIEKIHLTGKGYQVHFQFWKEYFSGDHEEFLFGSRPPAEEKNMALHACVLPEDVTGIINKLIKEDDSGLFVCTLSALGIVLKKYTGRQKITLNAPLFGGSESSIIQDIPLFLDADSASTLRDYLNASNKRVKECYHYQHFPIHEAVEKNMGYGSDILLKYGRIHRAEAVGSYNLVVELQKKNEQLELLFHYDPQVFTGSFIQNMALHACRVLSYFGELDVPISDIDLLDESEKVRLLNDFNNTDRAYPADKTVITLFESCAAASPSAIALQYRGQQLTYSQLDSKVNGLARHLVSTFSIGENDIVGLMTESPDQLIIAMLAILKAGAVYLPVDPHLPDDRKRFLLTNAAVGLLITDSWLFFQQDYYTGSAFLLDMELGNLASEAAIPVYSSNTARPAYVIYTSGTTGAPKGVLVGHNGLLNMVLDQIRQFGIVATDKVLQFASVSFDASISEIFMALCCGAQLVMIDRAVIKDDTLFLAFLRDNGISVLTLPPSYLSVISWKEFNFLRVIISAGEKLNTEAALALSRQVNYFNAYGPTECTVCVSINKISPEMTADDAESIGFPIANTKVYILNADGQLMPEGMQGEIYVGGAGLALGYLHMPELTADKFIAHPFDRTPGARLYRTGDFGKWLPNGTLAFSGRRDDQVKLRGFRVELSEIERTLSQSGLVKQSVLLIKEDYPGSSKLAAFVIPNGAFDKEGIISYLSARLPDYMIPALWLALPAFPLNNNGKVDKRKLLELSAVNASTEEYTAPRNETEEKLATHWKELMGLQQVGVYDDFFKMGGDSLLAIRVLAFIKEEFSLNIPMNVLFQFTNIADLASYISVVSTGPADADGKVSEVLLI
jgi:amino acid adenylation domain-containing protein